MLIKTAIFSAIICLFNLPVLAQTSPAPEAANPPVYGYSLEDKNNNGITDALENPVAAGAADSLAKNQAAPEAGQDIMRRSGFKNYHGLHGQELDRGRSPHRH